MKLIVQWQIYVPSEFYSYSLKSVTDDRLAKTGNIIIFLRLLQE